MNVSLPDQMKAWVEDQTKGGRYGNVSDYIRDLIREDQDRQTALGTLQAAVDEGLASGLAAPTDLRALIAKRWPDGHE